jgi:hypothetical protein
MSKSTHYNVYFTPFKILFQTIALHLSNDENGFRISGRTKIIPQKPAHEQLIIK